MLSTQVPNFLDKEITRAFSLLSEESIKKSHFTKIFRVYDTDEYSESFTSDEGIDDIAPLNESENVKDNKLYEGYKTTITSEEYAGSLRITKKMRLKAKDDTVKLAKMIAPKNKKLVIATRRYIERKAHTLLSGAFGSTLAPDLNPIIGTHTWKSGGTFSNQVTGNPLLSAAAWDIVQEMGADFTDPQGAEMPLIFDTIVVKAGSANARMARKLFGNKRLFADDITSINIYEDDNVTVIETPYLPAANKANWFAHDSSQENSLVVKFVQRAMLEDKQTNKALDEIFPITVSFEAGVDNMPYDWIGSDGSGS